MKKITSLLKHFFVAVVSLMVFWIFWKSFYWWSFIIFPSFFFLFVIFVARKKDISIPHISPILIREYFRTKFTVDDLKGEGGNIVTRLISFIYMEILLLLVLLFKSSEEGLEILRESMRIAREEDDMSSRMKVTIALKNIEKKVKGGEYIEEDEADALYEKLLALHRKKQERAAVFSMFSLLVILVSAIITSLILNFFIPKILK